MQFFVDRDTVRMLLSQKEAAQLSLCPQPDCNDPKVCENLSRLLRRAADGLSQKGNFPFRYAAGNRRWKLP